MPLHEWISKAIADDIAAGRLRPGESLPAQRDLADALRVALGTVTRAYASARRRGLVIGQRRRGTVVATPRAAENPLASLTSLLGERDESIDLAANLPVYAMDPDPSEALRQIASRPDVRQLLRYPPTDGLPRHRAAGTTWLKGMGVDAAPDDLTVCAGGQHGIIVSLAATARPGDTILVESLTYPGVQAAAQHLGLKLRTVAIDDGGLIPDAVEQAFKETDARVLYCVPSIHNPTTATLSNARKQRIAQLAERHGRWIIEDEIHRALIPKPTPALRAYAPERTLLISAVSKVVAASLRLGFIAHPKSLRTPLRTAVQATALAVCPLGGELFTTWLEDGTVQKTITRKRREVQRRQTSVANALKKVPGIRLRANTNAHLAWVELPTGRNASQLASDAKERGVRILPKTAFTCGQGTDDAIRLCVGSAEDGDALDRALDILTELLLNEQPPTLVF